MENKEPLLKVEHLKQYFRSSKKVIKAVDDVSFEIYPGEVFGLVGESGCGKTTTGRSIIRLYDITGGNVYFKGIRICAGTEDYKEAIRNAKANYRNAKKMIAQDASISEEDKKKKMAEVRDELDKCIDENRCAIAKAKDDHKNCNKNYADEQVKLVEDKYESLLSKASSQDEKKALLTKKREELRIAKKARIMNSIQMIFQDPIASLDPRMTVHDIIAEGLVIRGMKDQKEIEKIVFEALELVGLVPEHASRYPHEFSGGQRQRIGIARAIVLHPELIIADEPVSALDVSIQAQVINLLNNLRKQMNLTIMFIAHDLSVVKYFSDRIAVMYFGRIVELASSDELFAHPLHPYTKSLLSAIPLPDPDFEAQRVRQTYNPLTAHKYKGFTPALREVAPGHFVSCDDEEFAKYSEEVKI